MEGQGVLEEEDLQIKLGGDEHGGIVRYRLTGKKLHERGGQVLDHDDLGVGGGEGYQIVELGEETGGGDLGRHKGQRLQVVLGDHDGGVGVAMPVLQRPPIRRHCAPMLASSHLNQSGR